MVRPNINFWSISCEESLEPEEKHTLRNRLLWSVLRSNDLFDPGYQRKMLIRKRTSILDKVCFKNEQMFHPVQCTACKLCQFSSIDKIVLPRATGILSTSDQTHYIWGIKRFGNRTRQNSSCLYETWSLLIILFYNYILSILGQNFLCIRFFQCMAIVAFQFS